MKTLCQTLVCGLMVVAGAHGVGAAEWNVRSGNKPVDRSAGVERDVTPPADEKKTAMWPFSSCRPATYCGSSYCVTRPVCNTNTPYYGGYSPYGTGYGGGVYTVPQYQVPQYPMPYGGVPQYNMPMYGAPAVAPVGPVAPYGSVVPSNLMGVPGYSAPAYGAPGYIGGSVVPSSFNPGLYPATIDSPFFP